MNVELTDILTIIGTLGGFEAIKWSINFWVNRKTNARIEDAHADAEEFKALREYNEFLQKQLSEKTGITQADISKLESGNANPSLRTLQRLASGMGMKVKIEFQPIGQN